jgi:hypothetical protein
MRSDNGHTVFDQVVEPVDDPRTGTTRVKQSDQTRQPKVISLSGARHGVHSHASHFTILPISWICGQEIPAVRLDVLTIGPTEHLLQSLESALGPFKRVQLFREVGKQENRTTTGKHTHLTLISHQCRDVTRLVSWCSSETRERG